MKMFLVTYEGNGSYWVEFAANKAAVHRRNKMSPTSGK